MFQGQKVSVILNYMFLYYFIQVVCYFNAMLYKNKISRKDRRGTRKDHKALVIGSRADTIQN